MTQSKQTSMRIDPQQLEQLKTYSTITGVPMSVALREALNIFLECCAEPRIEAKQQSSGTA